MNPGRFVNLAKSTIFVNRLCQIDDFPRFVNIASHLFRNMTLHPESATSHPLGLGYGHLKSPKKLLVGRRVGEHDYMGDKQRRAYLCWRSAGAAFSNFCCRYDCWLCTEYCRLIGYCSSCSRCVSCAKKRKNLG